MFCNSFQSEALMLQRRLFKRSIGFVLVLLSWSMLSGCWATWSELKKERRLRESLEEQFRAFKRKQRKKERQRAEEQKRFLAQQAASLAQMQQMIQRFRSSFGKLQKRVKQGQGGVVEMFATLEKLQRNFQASLGQVTELQKQIKDLLQRLPERDKALKEIRKKYEDLLKNQKLLAEQAIPAKLFARGEDAMKRKDYPSALKLFKTFAQRFGSHELADNAYMFMGEIYRKQNRRFAAIAAFDDLVKKFPQGNTVPLALLRLGQLHYDMGRCREGRTYFGRLWNYRRRRPKLARIGRSYKRNWRRKCKRSRRTRRRRRRRRR